MGLAKLDNLYRQIILEYAQMPHHYGELTSATDKIELHNLTCGDVLIVQAKIKNNEIIDIAFTGHGCTISKASASMMTDLVIGKNVQEVSDDVLLFSDMVMGKVAANTTLEQKLGDATVFSNLKNFPARIKCATLAWKAIYQLIERSKSNDE